MKNWITTLIGVAGAASLIYGGIKNKNLDGATIMTALSILGIGTGSKDFNK